jgi:hypothetical protein
MDGELLLSFASLRGRVKRVQLSRKSEGGRSYRAIFLA